MGANLINWKGLIFYGCEILEPVDENLVTGKDNWKIKCPYDGNIFENKPSLLKYGNVKSCGCIKQKMLILKNKANQKHNYYGYINTETKVQILRPVDPLKEGCNDDWICLCPHHEIPVEFINIPRTVIYSKTSCGCQSLATSINNITNYLKKIRNEKGLEDNQLLSTENQIIRSKLFDPIKFLILKIDNFTCRLCNTQKRYLNAHHIYTLNDLILNNFNSLFKVYDIKNLITLCEECHWKAHDYSWHNFNQDIQQKLLTITLTRITLLKIQQEYYYIVSNQIKPWLDSYLLSKEK